MEIPAQAGKVYNDDDRQGKGICFDHGNYCPCYTIMGLAARGQSRYTAGAPRQSDSTDFCRWKWERENI